MKNYFIMFVALLCGALTTTAQDKGFSIGPRLGIGVSNFTGTSNITVEQKIGANIGLAANYQFFKFFGVGAEGLISFKGAKTTTVIPGNFINQTEKVEDRYRLYYIDVPVYAKVSLPLGPFHIKAFAGPSFNFNLDARQDREFERNTDNNFSNRKINGVNALDLGSVIGFGFDVESSGQLYQIDFRLSNSFGSAGKIIENPNNQGIYENATNQMFTINFGILF